MLRYGLGYGLGFGFGLGYRLGYGLGYGLGLGLICRYRTRGCRFNLSCILRDRIRCRALILEPHKHS